MRDMATPKFNRAARYLGFNPEPQVDDRQRPRQPVFVSFDGLRVQAVMVVDAHRNRRVHHRDTLARLTAARNAVTVPPKGEAARAGTPAASVDRQP